MIDVHAPEHGIHNVREFFLHLFTITIGLLIALGLEAGVEAIHHRHQREQAETLVRQEISDNLARLKDGAPVAVQELQQMTLALRALQALADRQPPTGTVKASNFAFRESPIQDAAWSTANSTGAVNFMDYAEVERFSDAYKEQALLQSMEEKALEDYLQLMPILSHRVDTDGPLTPEAAQNAIIPVQHAIAHLSGMLDVGQGTVGAYRAALKQ